MAPPPQPALFELGLKHCRKCGETKSLDDFAVEVIRPDGHCYCCKSCRNKLAQAWRARHSGRLAAVARDYRSTNGEIVNARKNARYRANRKEILAQQQAWRAANRDAVNTRNRERQHGLSGNDFDKLLASQGGGCAICGATEPNGRGWHVDHDHTLGCHPGGRSCDKCRRGILCHNCNAGTGALGDTASGALRAYEYLKSWEEKQVDD